MTAVLLIVAKRWKLSKCPLIAEWTSKLGYIHKMEYYIEMRMSKPQLHEQFNELSKYNIGRKKPDIKEYILYDCICMKFKTVAMNM